MTKKVVDRSQILAKAEHAIRNGNLDDAKKFYKKFLSFKSQHPDKVAAYFTYGNLLIDEGLVTLGIEQLKCALNENKFFEGHLELGYAYLKLKDYVKALSQFENAVAISTQSDRAFYGLACCHAELHGTTAALPFINNALKINPTAQYLDFAAVTYFMLGNYEVALKYQLQAHGLDGSYQSYSNLSDMLKKLGHWQEYYQMAVEMLRLHPDKVEAHQNLAFLLLLTGNYAKGWEEFEWRRKLRGYFRIYSKPFWDGTDLTNKTIFLYGEQGFGDIIQFVRFVPVLKQKYENLRIILECTPPLTALFSQLDVEELRTRPMDKKWNLDVVENFDVHCSILSLPLLLNNTLETIPERMGYLKADKDKVEKWRQNTDNYKIGLVWHGQAVGGTAVDTRRNIPLREFSGFFDLEGVQFYSLQKGEAAKHIKAEGLETKILDYTEEFHDFSDTAAFIENLDLVIGVDTAVIHLAGALGKPTWLLNRMDGCWRWMANRGDSPWYSSVSIYRQTSWLDWSSVFEQIATRLKNRERVLELKDVTLIIVDCVDYTRAKRALDRCMKLCGFKEAKILTHFTVEDSCAVKIEPLTSMREYSDFMVRRLGDYFSTSHVLVAQYDGFIVNPRSWSDEFLDYDYIGAPWPKSLLKTSDPTHDVGNGGFSLRSKKLYEALSGLALDTTHPEDVTICQWQRPRLEELGIRFAPNKLAARFSYENDVVGVSQTFAFGQHGRSRL